MFDLGGGPSLREARHPSLVMVQTERGGEAVARHLLGDTNLADVGGLKPSMGALGLETQHPRRSPFTYPLGGNRFSRKMRREDGFGERTRAELAGALDLTQFLLGEEPVVLIIKIHRRSDLELITS